VTVKPWLGKIWLPTKQPLRERYLLEDGVHISIKNQVATLLHVVGHNKTFRGDPYRQHPDILSKACVQFESLEERRSRHQLAEHH
jgi:hypothetical protein